MSYSSEMFKGDKRLPALLGVLGSGDDIDANIETASNILLAFDTIGEIVVELTQNKVVDGDVLRVQSYLIDLVWSRNMIFKHRDLINIAFDYDFTIDQHEDKDDFGEYGHIMNIINETSNLIDKYREMLKYT